MRKLRYTAAARSDIADIASYIADMSDSRATAERFAAELRAKCRDIAELAPIMGRPRAELREDIRSFPFKSYVIFFRYLDNGGVLEIVTIIEAHRDVAATFRDDQP